MTEKTYARLCGLLSLARHQYLRNWNDAWQTWPGAIPLSNVAAAWAWEIQAVNDAQIELQDFWRRMERRKEA